jgi:hypothetical protein
VSLWFFLPSLNSPFPQRGKGSIVSVHPFSSVVK